MTHLTHEVFDRQSLEEQARQVSRYVAGDLSRPERAEFEARLIALPSCRRSRDGPPAAGIARRRLAGAGPNASEVRGAAGAWPSPRASSCHCSRSAWLVLPGGERDESRQLQRARRFHPRRASCGSARFVPGTTPDITVSRLAPLSALPSSPGRGAHRPDGSIELEWRRRRARHRNILNTRWIS